MKETDARAKTIIRMMFSLFRIIIIMIRFFRMIIIIIRIIQDDYDDDDDDQDIWDALRIIMKMMSRAAVQQIGDPKIMRETAVIIIIILIIENPSQLSTSRIHTIF